MREVDDAILLTQANSLARPSVTLLQKHKLMSERNRQMLQRVQYLQNELIKASWAQASPPSLSPTP